jgi:hypothetical protein
MSIDTAPESEASDASGGKYKTFDILNTMQLLSEFLVSKKGC